MSTLPLFDDELRALAHQVVDRLFDHIQRVDSLPVVDWTSPDRLMDQVRIDDEPGGESFLALLEPLLDKSIQLHHTSYMGHQVCPPFPHAVLAEILISALNQSIAVWEMSPIATTVEKEVVRWLGVRAGYPASFAGTAVSGGSAANLTSLLAARARWLRDSRNEGKRPVVICSTDTHYSVARAAAIMGIPRSSVILVGTDQRHRMSLAELESTLAALEQSGTTPMAIVATSGSTAVGSFDELLPIAELRDRYRTWLHVDAAHGASVLLSDRLRHLVRGIERADSFCWDPHKMLWMPLSLGVVLVREGHWLRAAFQADAPYLFDERRAGENIGEMTIQCSKRADAIKLWLSLKTLGARPFAAAMEHLTDLTRHLHRLVAGAPDFEPLHEPEFNILCFRYRGSGRLSEGEIDQLNQEIREQVIRSGRAWITSTALKGRRALRTTLINPRTGVPEVEAMLELVRQTGRQIHGQAAHGVR